MCILGAGCLMYWSKEAAVEESEEGTKTYKVTFTDAEGTDSEVFFNEKGEVLK